jgi:CPA1 family monovalent cation:H+ antiporter
MDASQVVATLFLILTNSCIAIFIARLSKLPITLCVLIMGMICSAIVPLSGFDTGIRAENFQTLILYALIPILVFEAALSLNFKILKPLLATVIFASTVGIIVSTLIAATILYYAIGHAVGFPWIAALIAGLVISATDPVAVVAQLKDANAPKKLATLIEGESLFNDASAIVLFGILLAMAISGKVSTISAGSIMLVKVLFGGIIVGVIFAALGTLLVRLINFHPYSKLLVSLTIAYGSFFVAEHLFHVSGVIAVLVAALMSKKAFSKHQEIEKELHHTWESMSFIANLIVFYLMGLVVTYSMFSEQWLAMLMGIVAAFTSRLISSYISVGTGRFIFRDQIEWNYTPVMIWGGLRGVITLALVLSLPVELDYWWTIQSIGFGVVLFTLIVQSTTNPLLVKKLKLIR